MTDTEEDSTGSDSWPVNEDWLIDMLKQHHCTSNDIKIADFSAKQGCNDGVSNNLSDILAISVVYNIASLPLEMASTEVSSSSEKLEFIIKLLPHDPFSRYFVTEAKFDLREIRFYTRVMPDLMEFQSRRVRSGYEKMSISVPKCFYTHYSPGKVLPATQSPEPPESILVLEDMRSAGYKVIFG
jgi:Ecdysteroid kinase-like family